MKNTIQTVFGLVLTLLLAACGTTSGGSGGSNGGDPGGAPVTVRQTEAWPLEGSYFRTGNGSWQTLSFSNGQATFTANNDYEVMVRCKSSYPYVAINQLTFFKATVSQTQSLSFSCDGQRADLPLPTATERSFQVSLPASIGNQALQPGDQVNIATGIWHGYGGVYSGGPVSLSGIRLFDGEQEVLFTVVRPADGAQPAAGTLIGYKLVKLNLVGGGPFSVDATGWKPFAATAAIGNANGFVGVRFFREGMKSAFSVSEGDRYGVLSEPGKYLGEVVTTYSRQYEFGEVLKETGGKDWSPSPMDPWPSGGFKLEDGTLTLNHPQARIYVVDATGLFREAQIPVGLRARIVVYASGSGPTVYTLPTAPGVVLQDFSSREGDLYVLSLRGDLRGIYPYRWMDTLTDEDFLSGLDTTYVANYTKFKGHTYVLP